jgi:hypothetical protein
MPSRYVISWWIYGVIVVASGCYRYFSRPDGEKGLYFGLVMGALALVAAWLLGRGRALAGHAAGLCSVGCVLGWFLFEALIKDGGSHELRLLLVAGISIVQLTVALRHLRAPRTR